MSMRSKLQGVQNLRLNSSNLPPPGESRARPGPQKDSVFLQTRHERENLHLGKGYILDN